MLLDLPKYLEQPQWTPLDLAPTANSFLFNEMRFISGKFIKERYSKSL
jgi:hypothetical protein